MDGEAGYACGTCGESHAGLPMDVGFRLPDDVHAIPAAQRSSRARFNSDLCEMDGRFFFRCLLEIPIVGRGDYYGWGVWVGVDPPTFKRYLKIYDDDASNEPPRSGKLANRLPLYPDADGETVIITFGDGASRPKLHLPADSRSSLANDQRAGIGPDRLHDYLIAASAR